MRANLTPEMVIEAYRVGIFPMADEDGEIGWFSPDPRCVFPLSAFHVPRTTRQVIQRGTFELRINTAFGDVMRGCADREEGTWISDEIYDVYSKLHERGQAHSVEAWHEGVLAGGLYGVAIGGAFFGESMFHRITNASKVALVGLVERLRARGFTLLDTQWNTPHLAMFGSREIPRDDYLELLNESLARDCSFSD